MKIIVAYTVPGRIIGNDGKLPWHYPEDLKRFKQITTGETIIMGSKTYYSIGKPLPNRRNIVISRQNIKIPNVEVMTFENAIKEHGFCIGGGEIFKQVLDIPNLITEIYATEINQCILGDTFFPEFDWISKDVIGKSGNLTFINYKIRQYK